MEPKRPIALNVLLADDDADDRLFFKKALETLPVANQLITVYDGERLMDHLSKNTENLPDVLFLDLNLPRKNGKECLQEIKENESFNRIPVIIYSTSLREEVADTLYSGGAYYYLQKCDFNELPKALETVFALLAENPLQPSRDKFIIPTGIEETNANI